MAKELLFSLTKKDFVIQFSRGTGAGGQKRNKTSSKCRIFHPESGAESTCDETRSSIQNQAIAFKKLIESKTFQAWHRLKVGEMTKSKFDIDAAVNKSMDKRNIRVETHDENGLWEEKEIDERV